MATTSYTYLVGRAPVGERRGGADKFYWLDHSGSLFELTDPAGTTTDEFEFDFVGDPVSRVGTTPTPFQWRAASGVLTPQGPPETFPMMPDGSLSTDPMLWDPFTGAGSDLWDTDFGGLLDGGGPINIPPWGGIGVIQENWPPSPPLPDPGPTPGPVPGPGPGPGPGPLPVPHRGCDPIPAPCASFSGRQHNAAVTAEEIACILKCLGEGLLEKGTGVPVFCIVESLNGLNEPPDGYKIIGTVAGCLFDGTELIFPEGGEPDAGSRCTWRKRMD
jgi:hypothetical protein